MECLDITKYLKINRKKSIGTVLIIVEGAKTEMDLFNQIFHKVLGYKYVEKRRTKDKFNIFDEYKARGNESSRIIVINHENSNISLLNESSLYLDELFKTMYLDHGVDIKNIPIYYIWDRDSYSNPKAEVVEAIKKFDNAQENSNGDMHGLLLLSYPNIESYIISNFDAPVPNETKNQKNIVKKYRIEIKNIDENTLLKAVSAMGKSLLDFGIKEFNLNDFKKVSLKIFDKEERVYTDLGYYRRLSLVSMILLDLGIIIYK